MFEAEQRLFSKEATNAVIKQNNPSIDFHALDRSITRILIFAFYLTSLVSSQAEDSRTGEDWGPLTPQQTLPKGVYDPTGANGPPSASLSELMIVKRYIYLAKVIE